MRVLWLCNIVLPEYADEFGIKKSVYGGWMTGMLNALEDEQEYDIALCFPIIDKSRLKNGEKNGHRYFSFHCDFEADDYGISGERMTRRFEEILNDYKPDVIHIWGTEYIHTYAMVIAAENVGCLSKVIVHIQGLVSVCANYYLQDLSYDVISNRVEGYNSIEDQYKNLKKRGIWEKLLLTKVKYVLGRTDWDYAHVRYINHNIRYLNCGEILREEFYNTEKWEYSKILSPYSVFMTQGSYPIKGLHYAIKAIALLKKSYPGISLEIAGDDILKRIPRNAYANYIYGLIYENGLQNNINYIGMLTVEELIEKYRKSHVYILPSSIENSPNSLCEAMMIGIPVVASYVGGVSSIIRNQSEGLLYRYNDPEMLAFQIERAFSSSIYKEGICINERIRAQYYNSKDRCLAELESAYREVSKE